MGRFVILSGPSCVGKGPLHSALKKVYPELAEKLKPLVLYNDRAPRPSEKNDVDYHFRSREEIEKLRGKEGYSVFEVRGDLQAVDISELHETLEEGDAFFEGNPFVGSYLLECPLPEGVERLSIFLSPLSRAEVKRLRAEGDIEKLLTSVMRRKLLRRTQKQRGLLGLPDLEEVERRAGSAWKEVCLAPKFEYVLPNHDGEDSENWDAFYHPVGDAFRVLHAFASLLKGEETEVAEKWDEIKI